MDGAAGVGVGLPLEDVCDECVEWSGVDLEGRGGEGVVFLNFTTTASA